MSIEFTCPHCGEKNENMPANLGGTTGTCRACKKPVPAIDGKRRKRITWLVIAGIAGIILLLIPLAWAGLEARRRTMCSRQLQLIGLALHNYHDAYGALPPAYTVDDAGNRLHSWRTLILPFMERSDVYDQIDLSKPWNAPENAHAARLHISEYCCPSSEHGYDGSCASQYVVIVGEGMSFESTGSISFSQISDGNADTLLVTELTGRSQHWMEPTDLELEARPLTVNDDPTAISSEHPGGAHALMADGSVLFVSDETDPSSIHAALTVAGGELHELGEEEVEEDVEVEESPDLLARKILKQALARGTLTRVVKLTPPPTPSPHLDGTDLRQLTPRQLADLAAGDDYAIDPSKGIPALYYYVQATGRGRFELAMEYFGAENYEAVPYWLQEAIVEEGLAPWQQSRLRLSSKPFWSPAGQKVAALSIAGAEFWKRLDEPQSELTLPQDYDGQEPLAVLVCLHPAVRSPHFYPAAFREGLANDFQIAVLSVAGTHRCGSESFYWTEDWTEHYQADLAAIDAAIAQHSDRFREQEGERLALGVADGALIAFGAAYWQPDKYAGAISLEPHYQVGDGVQYGQVTPTDSHARQHFLIAYEEDGTWGLFAQLQAKVAAEAGASVSLEPITGVDIYDATGADFGTMQQLSNNDTLHRQIEAALAALRPEALGDVQNELGL